MDQRFIQIGDKKYDMAPLTMSPESIELLETAYDMQSDSTKAIKALPLMYRIMIDCMVRGGSVKDEAEAKAALSNAPINRETIEGFLKSMMGTAAGADEDE